MGSTESVVQTVEPVFIHEGSGCCCPIPRDAPNVKGAELPIIKAINGTKEEDDKKYDQSFEAKKMVKGEYNNECFTHISIPFSSFSPMKGAYICLCGFSIFPPSHLIFTLTSTKGDKTSKKYEFPGLKGNFSWYFLPVDLPDVVLCEITGKGRKKEYFGIESLVFISREETPEEIASREAREKLWSEAPVVKPEFVKEGDEKSFGKDSIPIPRDDPKLVDPSFSMVKCKNDSKSKESKGYDRSSEAQKMLKGEDDVLLSHLSIPFPSPSPMKAREKLWSEAPVVKPEFVKEGDEKSFGKDSIPIPRDDPKLVDPSFSMVKCKNDSKSKESKGYDRSSEAQKMLKGEDDVLLSHLSIPFPSPSPMKGAYICVNKYTSSPCLLFTFTDCDGKKTYKKYEFTRPKHIYEWHFLPIDLYNVVLCEIEGKGTWDVKNCRHFIIYSLVFLRGYADIDIAPKITSRSLKCAGFSSDKDSLSKSTSLQQSFDIQTVNPPFIHEGAWYYSPIPRDAPNIKNPEFSTIKAHSTKESKEIGANQSRYAQAMMKGEVNDIPFSEISLPFAPTPLKGAYVCLNRDDLPMNCLIFTFTSSKRKITFKKYDFERKCDGYGWYFLSIDLSDVVLCEIVGSSEKSANFKIKALFFIREARSVELSKFKFKENLWLTTLPTKSEFIKEGGIFSCPISRDHSSILRPSFSKVMGKDDSYCKESTRYDQSSNAKKMVNLGGSVALSHLSIPFISPSSMKGAYICIGKDYGPLSLLFTFTDSDGKKTSKKYEFTQPKHEFEWHFLPIDLLNVVLCEIEGKGTWCDKKSRWSSIQSLIFIRNDDIPTSSILTHVPSSSSKTKEPSISVKEEAKTKSREESKYNPKHDSLTLTSASTITPQCIIGSGGFGEVLLVKVDGIPFPCVLKKMLRIADETVVKGCRKEFKVQLKLFNNPKCFNRIPRPLYILDLLDCDMKGVYGFLMEFCVGGSVSAFAKRWCADGKYVSAKDDEESESDTSSKDEDEDPTLFDPMTLNPVKVAALCVGMIECLDDVFTAKKKLIHRDIKP
ncbi:hypothetical protein ADUPG1_000140, partial [Aduncisulcus paluster]